jgi:hypothetical protein
VPPKDGGGFLDTAGLRVDPQGRSLTETESNGDGGSPAGGSGDLW